MINFDSGAYFPLNTFRLCDCPYQTLTSFFSSYKAHADSAEAVVGILRLVESLLRMRDDLSFQQLRCGFLLEGQTFRNPHALATVPGRTLDPCVPPHVRVALSSVSDKSQGEFPSGVIEAGAFDACSAAKRFLISRFLVMMADDESGDGTSEHVLTSLATQHEVRTERFPNPASTFLPPLFAYVGK